MAIKHRIKANGKGKTKIVSLTARQAILENCKECMGFEAKEVLHCTSPLCPLFPFRTRRTPVSTV